MELNVQTLWSAWDQPLSRARAVSEPVSVAPVENDVEAFVQAVAAMLGADEALLTLHSEKDHGSPAKIISAGDVLLRSAEARASMLAMSPVPAFQGWAQPASGPEWSTCTLDQKIWNVLRLPIWSRRARTCVVVSLLYRSASLADRSRTFAKLETMRPMLEPFIRIWQRMRVQSRRTAGLREALDSIEMGALLLDRESKIIFSNKAANAFILAGDPLRQIGDVLSASDLKQAVPLQVALSHAIAANSDRATENAGPRRSSLLALRSARSSRSLVLSVVPAEHQATEHLDAAAVVYIIDPNLDTLKQLQPVCALFGLSPVETRLVCLLTAGQTLQDAAKAMRIKDQTARSYLKQIFLKTDTRRQPDLVRVMLCSLLRTDKSVEPVFLSR